MPSTLMVIVLAVVTAVATTVATTLVIGLLFTPRLEARKRRIQEAHTARDTFNTKLTGIISACTKLQAMPLPAEDDPACSPVVRERLTAERARWMQQLDEATQWMIDHVETYAAGWPVADLRDAAAGCAAQCRMVMLSERTTEAKVEHLAELAGATQHILFTYWWRRVAHYGRDRAQLATAHGRLTPTPLPAPHPPEGGTMAARAPTEDPESGPVGAGLPR